MPLPEHERLYVIETACDVLRHRQRARALAVLAARVRAGDGYADDRERALDRLVLAVARSIDAELGEEP